MEHKKQSLSALMVDADNFKSFNDHYGHATGDRALRIIARCIVENIRRPGDFVGRYGGEEFCVLLPNTDLRGAVQVAERIRSAVLATDQANFACPSGRLSVSIGVAVFYVNPMPGDTADQLVELADQRLYEAKAAGRNAVMPRQNTPANGGGLRIDFGAFRICRTASPASVSKLLCCGTSIVPLSTEDW